MDPIIENASAHGAMLRELGGWGIAVVFMSLFVWLLRTYFKIQDHVFKLSTALATTNAKTVASLEAVKSKMEALEGIGSMRKDVNKIEEKVDRVNERLVELRARQGDRT